MYIKMAKILHRTPGHRERKIADWAELLVTRRSSLVARHSIADWAALLDCGRRYMGAEVSVAHLKFILPSDEGGVLCGWCAGTRW